MNIKAYLERINYHGSLAPTAESLRELQVAHLLTVPFENLSIHAGQPIVLENDALFTKIVENRRGGFCYEANGLFAELLRALGFGVAMLSAEVANAEGEFGPNFDHLALMVLPLGSSARRWLVDVGFGDSFREPLLLDEPAEQVQGARAYRILSNASDATYLVLMKQLRILLNEFTNHCDVIAPDRVDELAGLDQSRPTRCFITAREGELCISQLDLIGCDFVWVMLVELGDGGRIAFANGAQQILRLVFELIEVRTDGKSTIGHDEPPLVMPAVRFAGRKEVRKGT